MRNTITIFDGDRPRPKFGDLEVGEMFRYPQASDPSNVYMKSFISKSGEVGILLATGIGYEFNIDKEVDRITSIRIAR